MGSFFTNPSVDIIGGADPSASETLGTFTTVLIVLLVALGIGLLVALVYYVLYALGLYRIAKKLEVNNAFLAWIPFAQYFTLGKVAEKCDERRGKTVRPWGIIVLLGSVGAGILGGVLGAVGGIVSIIPILGLIIYLVCYMIIMVLAYVPLVLDCICRWKIYREFYPETVNIVLFIVGVVLGAQSIITLVASFRQPAPAVNEGAEDAYAEDAYSYEYNA